MSIAHPSTTSVPATLPIRRLSVAQYDAMAAAGILGPDDRIELLDGLLVEKMTKKPPHRIATRRTIDALTDLVPPGWYVDAQEPIVTADSEPEPDVVVIVGDTGDYVQTNPAASAVALVVEVSDDSLARDREIKGPIYARAGIPTYWIVNLVDRCVEVYTEPSDGRDARYGVRVDHTGGGSITVTLGGLVVGAVAVDALLR